MTVNTPILYGGAYHNTITTFDDRTVANIRASYKFNNWVRVDFNGGINSYGLFRDQIIDKSSYGGADNPAGNLTEVEYRQQEINGKILAVFTPKINKDWSLDVNLGVDVNERNTRNQVQYGADFVVRGLYNLRNTRRQRFDGDSRSKRRLVGLFGDASIGYKNFAFLTVTAREDLTSTLPYAEAQYFYPGISTSIVWSDALNLKSSWLDYGKIRAGFARVGKDADPHNTEAIFALNAAGFAGQPLATRGGTVFDPKLTPNSPQN
ncbi:hypothetical protein [Paraflavitalea speifideaquila]|uniref:hypothetical protein n=1 Tax=Paraflavitalea speifideaquila TaxID=3076558 RepID=UPI0028F01AF3|nr:hypothetical protein [Paraflavitalea speifideiaquila]